MPDTHEFLSDAWIDAAKVLRDEAGPGVGVPPHKFVMNLGVIDVPEAAGVGGTFEGHMDTTGDELEMDKGHLETADLTVTVPYDIAKAIFVDQNAQAGMQAFMSGQVKVQGDISKLMAMQSSVPDEASIELAKKIQAITA